MEPPPRNAARVHEAKKKKWRAAHAQQQARTQAQSKARAEREAEQEVRRAPSAGAWQRGAATAQPHRPPASPRLTARAH